MEELHRQHGNQLKRIKEKVEQQLERAKEARQVIPERVYKWLAEAQKIVANIDKKPGSSLWDQWFLINRRERNSEDETVMLMRSLSDVVARGRNISWVDFPVDYQGIDELEQRDNFVYFNSRSDVFERIMLDLKNDKGGIIGIFGMGGMGKTRLVMEIVNKAKHHKLFNEVVILTLTQNSNIRNIQDMLSEKLNLFLNNEGTEDERSNEIQTAIKRIPNILVILDSVWEKVDIEHIGIPSQSEHNGCKIIITTRSKGVCENMGCVSPVSLERIHDEEALSLFIKHACPQQKPDVKKIADECGGLPLALVIVGRALRFKGLEEYQVAALKLSRSSFVNVESTETEIYACLKLSYDYLDDIETQKCFLLCSLFPEDTKIEVEGLTRYAYGVGLFSDVNSVDQARQKMIACVTKLEDACLLSLVEDYYIGVVDVATINYLSHVKMHDMVRDIAIWIAKLDGLFLVPASLKDGQRKQMFEKTTAVYLNPEDFDNKSYPHELVFPNLKILVIRIPPKTLPGNLFKTTCSLEILDLVMETTRQNFGQFGISLPVSFKSLVNLKVLRITGEYLSNNDEMSKISEFKKLEILELSFPQDEKILPEWIGELYALRVLDLSQCFHLEEIPINVLRKLTKLEELYTPRYHETEWSHAFVEELILFPCLSILTGWFSQNGVFEDENKRMLWSNQYWRARVLKLDDFDDESLKILKRMLSGTECLDLGMKLMPGVRNLCPQLDDTGFQYLTKLMLRDSMSLECFIDNTETLMTTHVLPNLLELSLSGMEQFHRMISNGPPPHLNFLGKLTSLLIEFCPKIENLVPDILPIAPQLAKLHIESCGAIKFLYNHAQTTREHLLQSLSCEMDDAEVHIMTLEAMLISFTLVDISTCNNLEEVFPNSELKKQHCNWKLAKLAELKLECLPKLPCIWKAPQQNYRLFSLRKVYVSKCDKLSSVFTPTLALSLVKLESLVIRKCAMLETIISAEDEPSLTGKPHYYSSSLGGMTFPELKNVFVKSCHNLKTVLPFAFAARCLPKLNDITLRNCDALEEVFGAGNQNSHNTVQTTQDVPPMNNGISLELTDLPKLVPFSEFSWNKMLASLLDLKISGTTFKHNYSKIMLAPSQEEKSNAMLPIRAAVCLREMEVDSEGFFSSAKEIFDGEDAQESILTGLRFLKLGNMLKVQHLWKGPSEFSSLCNLEKIYIHDCPAIKTFFPHSFCLSLHSLKSLKVDNCKQLKNIFDPSDDDHINNEPRLHGKCFPKLNKVRVHNCPVLETIFPVCVASNFPCLKSYEVEGCPMLENISISGSGFHVRIT